MKCLSCDHINLSDSKFCTNCGAKIILTTTLSNSICKSCNLSNDEIASFCVNCGESLSKSESSKSIGAINYFESLLGYSHDSPEFEKNKIFAISVLQKSKYLTENFTKGQIGEIANNSIMTSSYTLMTFTLPVFLPDIFNKLDSPRVKKQLYQLLLELLELGCLMKMPSFMINKKTDNFPFEQINDPTTQKIFIQNAEYIFSLFHELRGLDKYANRIGDFEKKMCESFVDKKIMPFYKSNGIKGGFMNTNLGNLSLHSRSIFYVGVSLSQIYNDLV